MASFSTFDGTYTIGFKVETWILGMKRYFKIHDYVRITIFNLNGRALIWWENLIKVKGINERKIDWEQFQKYFQEKFPTTRYYDSKRK